MATGQIDKWSLDMQVFPSLHSPGTSFGVLYEFLVFLPSCSKKKYTRRIKCLTIMVNQVRKKKEASQEKEAHEYLLNRGLIDAQGNLKPHVQEQFEKIDKMEGKKLYKIYYDNKEYFKRT